MNWKKGLKRIVFYITLVSAILSGIISVGSFVLCPYWAEKDEFDYIKKIGLKQLDSNELHEKIYEMALLRLSDSDHYALSYDLDSDFNRRYTHIREYRRKEQKEALERLKKVYGELRLKEEAMIRSKLQRKLNQLISQNFWLKLSIPALVALCIVAALGGAAVGFSVAWAVLWGGGFVIYKLIRWLALGFRDEETS